MKNLRTLLFALLFMMCGIIQAQEIIPVSGGEATGTGGTISYTIGQVFYTTSQGTNASVAQGVQQPYEIFTVTAIEETERINLKYKVYPNPTTNLLILEVDFSYPYNISSLVYQLFDMDGKLIKNDMLNTNETVIQMEHLPASTYFLRIVKNNTEVKTFKIIKN